MVDRQHTVAGRREPRSRAAALALFGECVPSLKLARPAGKLVLEAAKRAAAFDRDGQALGPAGILDGRDEQLHVPVALASALAVDRQPPLGIISGVLVFLPGLQGVFDRRLRPDLTGPDIDAAPDAEWVAFEDAGQLLEIDRQARSIAAGPTPS